MAEIYADAKKPKNLYVCHSCGVPYLTSGQLKEKRIVTCHKGTCCVCDEVKDVAHVRNYNGLDEDGREWQRLYEDMYLKND